MLPALVFSQSLMFFLWPTFWHIIKRAFIFCCLDWMCSFPAWELNMNASPCQDNTGQHVRLDYMCSNFQQLWEDDTSGAHESITGATSCLLWPKPHEESWLLFLCLVCLGSHWLIMSKPRPVNQSHINSFEYWTPFGELPGCSLVKWVCLRTNEVVFRALFCNWPLLVIISVRNNSIWAPVFICFCSAFEGKCISSYKV